MTAQYAQRLARVPQSFIREILQVTLDPGVISFAGGLPNASTFPVTELAEATQKVYQSKAKEPCNTSTTADCRNCVNTSPPTCNNAPVLMSQPTTS